MRLHCCLLSRSCWSNRRAFGIPMRLHVGARMWTLLAEQSEKFEELTPATLAATATATCDHMSITGPISAASCARCGPLDLAAVDETEAGHGAWWPMLVPRWKADDA